jgi:hypothetical protein
MDVEGGIGNHVTFRKHFDAIAKGGRTGLYSHIHAVQAVGSFGRKKQAQGGWQLTREGWKNKK